jgi:hypothetical protein
VVILYILSGGVNFWLDVYGNNVQDSSAGQPQPESNDKLRHTFEAALGSTHPAADPDHAHAPKRTYTKKVKLTGPSGPSSGGCG